ncbi:bleomycin resistance family protein [Candidatus Peregrinibacteria bacterium]|nr:MAG: bleomycin resistance family protein [Candidatus Peregrinibacteria bacterium]
MKIVMKQLNPNLMVKDIRETADFYERNLGFSLVMAVPKGSQDAITDISASDDTLVWMKMNNGDVSIMFQEIASFQEDAPFLKSGELGASGSFYMEVENLEKVVAALDENVSVLREISTTWYGMKEFYMYDNNGYIVVLCERLT